MRPVRILGDDEVRAPLADLAGDISPEGTRVLDLSVVVAEEFEMRDPERPRGVPLLRLAEPREAVPAHRAVARPHVAAGDDDIRHGRALLDQLGDGTSRTRFRVVRVRHCHHHAFDPVRHGVLPSRPAQTRSMVHAGIVGNSPPTIRVILMIRDLPSGEPAARVETPGEVPVRARARVPPAAAVSPDAFSPGTPEGLSSEARTGPSSSRYR